MNIFIIEDKLTYIHWDRHCGPILENITFLKKSDWLMQIKITQKQKRFICQFFYYIFIVYRPIFSAI